jgi:hypothetical protein
MKQTYIQFRGGSDEVLACYTLYEFTHIDTAKIPIDSWLIVINEIAISVGSL